MSPKPLSEVYAGSLSRNWPKLLDLAVLGETRVLVCRYRDHSNGRDIDETPIVTKFEKGKFSFFQCEKDRSTAMKWLDGEWKFWHEPIGFFPANEDEK